MLADSNTREQRSERACLLLGSQFGIVGSTSEIRSKIKSNAQTADAVIDLLRGKLLAPYASHVETSNEIETTHDPEDYRCVDVKVIDAASRACMTALGEDEKLTLFKRRVFEEEGRDFPAYVSVRKKGSAAKVLKLLRKNEKNPAVAVDDELGLMAVLDGISDVKRFVRL